MADEEELRDLACAVLDDPLHRDRAKHAALRADPDRGEQRLVAKHRDNRAERRLEELEDVKRCIRAVYGLRVVRGQEHLS